MKLWYDEPAEDWNRALPVGGGKLGAMVFGGVSHERIQMNEDSIWAGPPVPKSPPGAQQVVARARQLLFEGQYTEAQNLVQEGVMGERIAPRSYQTLGDLFIEQNGVEQHTDYRRHRTKQAQYRAGYLFTEKKTRSGRAYLKTHSS